MANQKVTVPDIGDYHDVPVIELLVANGDAIDKDAPLLVLESDKATLEVPAPASGVVRKLKLKLGDKVSQGAEICELEIAAEAAPAAQPPADSAPVAKVETPKDAEPPVAAQTVSAPDGGSGRVEVTIPDIGDYHDVPVIEILVHDGDAVEKDAPLLVLESDKATLEVPAPASGTVRDFRLKLGDKVSQGAAVCTLVGAAAAAVSPAAPRKSADATVPATPAPKSVQAVVSDAAPLQPPPEPKREGEVPYAGPATRKFARELGVDLSQVKGSAARGRIVIEDVQGFVKQRLAQTTAASPAVGGSGILPIPAVDFAQFGEIETRPLARIRKLSAAHLHRAWLNVPHVTQTDEADITELEAFRKAQSDEAGVKLTLLPFVIKAVAAAIRQYPEFASSLAADGENLILKKYLHIGFAADTPNGLVVPVVRNVDQKGIVQLAQETAELAKKARDGKLKADEMKGGCFSISSLGGIGGSFFTPIVNAPEVAILGVSKSQIKPVWDGKQFAPRLLCPLSLSYDHRVIDGAYAARFIVLLGKLLGDLRRLAL
ncbi:dihydrolipoyllysine-residue acetyltransferase [Solimonas terrae]|uniref:Acetyltransferase component of pyruvate dehydrogenase complex n=1 Tax=Solimonas terrae TaxID=1396819 RepID=A0A6M2BVU8_9GAMM|nr:dihydrolipoyllysine-residue acetyltransferase [Solimonas terrae]NGY06480.1 dihydrolipoyllysine-residue acetyltransferase [Solimonas terrae]